MPSRSKQQNASTFAPIVQFSWYLFGAFSLLGVLISGLLIVQQETLRIEKYEELSKLRTQQDQALQEHSRLLIERSSLASFQRVSDRARETGELAAPEAIEPLTRPAR